MRPVRGIHLPALSPDGRHIAFAALNSLWLAGISGRAPARATAEVRTDPLSRRHRSGHATDGPSRTPTTATDCAGVYRRDLATGEETALATGGGHPRSRPTGSGSPFSITRKARPARSGQRCGTRPGDPARGGGLPGRPSWSPDGRYLVLCDRNRLNLRFREGYNVIRIVDTTTGTDRLHAVAPHVCIADRYDSGPVWSPDGRWMAVVVESALCVLPCSPTAPRPAPRAPSPARTRRPPLLVRRLENSPVPLGGQPAAHRHRHLHDRRTVRVPLDQHRTAPADTVVHAGRLWDGTGGETGQGRRGHRRTRRTRRRSRAAPGRGRGALRRIDASNRTVIPGLWDTHTHPWQSTYGGRQTVGQLTYGITTAVSLADSPTSRP